MIPYLIILLSFTLIYSLKIKQSYKLIMYMIIIFIITAFRSEFIGADIQAYKNYFDYYSSNLMSLSTYGLELGYVVLNKIVYIIFKEYRYLLIIIAFFNTYSIYNLLKKYNKFNCLSSLWIFICMTSFQSGFTRLRQVIAISIILFGLKYLEKKEIHKYLITVIIAILFHQSSIAYIGLLLINLNWRKKTYFFMFFTIPIVYIFSQNSVSIISNIPLFSNYTEKYFISNNLITGEGIYLIFVYFFVFIFMFVFLKKKNYNDYSTKLCFICAYYMLVFQIMSPYFSLFSRIGWYFTYIFSFFFPIYLDKNINNVSNLKKITALVYFFMFVYYLYLLFNGIPSKTVPYFFMF